MAAVVGELFVGGCFSACDSAANANVAHLNPVTGEFTPLGTGVNGIVRALTDEPHRTAESVPEVALWQGADTGRN